MSAASTYSEAGMVSRAIRVRDEWYPYLVCIETRMKACKFPGRGDVVVEWSLASAPAVMDDFGDIVIVGRFL